jgi:hypothetical protein
MDYFCIPGGYFFWQRTSENTQKAKSQKSQNATQNANFVLTEF